MIGSVEAELQFIAADAIITQGFLMHLPDGLSTESVFDAIAFNAGELILTNEIEDRPFLPDYRFMRNYQEVFEARGWLQVRVQSPDVSSMDVSHSKTRIFLRDE